MKIAFDVGRKTYHLENDGVQWILKEINVGKKNVKERVKIIGYYASLRGVSIAVMNRTLSKNISTIQTLQKILNAAVQNIEKTIREVTNDSRIQSDSGESKQSKIAERS